MSDMEFSIVKLKGKKDSFIIVTLEATSYQEKVDMNFLFNELGTWSLESYEVNNNSDYGGSTSKQRMLKRGNIQINSGTAPNIIRIEHRSDTLRYFVNGELATSFVMNKQKSVDWGTCSVESQKSNVGIALDKVTFKGFATKEQREKKMAELEQKKADQAAALGLTTKIKTRTHILFAYPGWAGIFNNPEDSSSLRSNYGNKTPAQIFKEAPDGWLKNEPSLYSLNILLDDFNATLETATSDFFQLAMSRTGLTRDKIQATEEQITLADGRKGVILFYVCASAKGYMEGNYFNCHLYVESEKSKEIISVYRIFIEGGNPDLPASEAVAWKDYFKKVLLTISPR